MALIRRQTSDLRRALKNTRSKLFGLGNKDIAGLHKNSRAKLGRKAYSASLRKLDMPKPRKHL